MISLIVATDLNGLIGKGNALPWICKEDLKLFKETTLGKTLIVGRKTFESMPPLRERRLIVMTRTHDIKWCMDKIVEYSLLNCEIQICPQIDFQQIKSMMNSKEKYFVAGGAEIYGRFYQFADEIIMSIIQERFEGDVFFPIPMNEIEEEFTSEKLTVHVGEKYEFHRHIMRRDGNAHVQL